MDLLESLIATYAVVGQEMTDIGMKAILADLRQYPEADVKTALTRCRKELKKLTLADILERLPGGHPKVEEAWAIVAPSLNNEAITIVWTEEMARAMGAARSLADDPIAARMAFKEVYATAVLEARAKSTVPKWTVSLGHDPLGREGPVQEAVLKGRLIQEYAQKFLPDLREPINKNIALPSMKGFCEL